MTTRTLRTDRLSELECRRAEERASREFEACRIEERRIRSERRLFFAGCAILAATMAAYVAFDRWDRELNLETERIMNDVRFDENGHRIIGASFDGSVWLSPSEREGRRARPTLLGK